MNLQYKHSRTLNRLSMVSVLLLCLLVSRTSLANPLTDTHIFRLGVFEQDIDVDASVTRDPFPKLEIDFDKKSQKIHISR